MNTTINPSTNSTSWRDASGPIAYPATNDLIFHMILERDEEVLQGLISSLLHIPLTDIISTHIENPLMLADYVDHKGYTMDIKVRLNDKSIINLEMQVINEDNWTDRSLSYLCRNFDNVARGDDYYDVMPVTHIGILDFNLFPEFPEFYATYKLMNIKNQHVYNDKFTLSVLSLNQIDIATDEDKKWSINQWAKVFKAKTWEDLRMAATTTTLEKVADSIYVQNTDDQIRYAMFKKQEAEIHEARLKRKQAELEQQITEAETKLNDTESKLNDTEAKLIEANNKLDEKDAKIAELQNRLAALEKK